MIIFYILSKRYFLKREGLSKARVVSIIEKEYGFAVHFLLRLIKYWISMSDEWFNAIYCHSVLNLMEIRNKIVR